MRALIQRVSYAKVEIPAQNYTAEIKNGMLIFLGIKLDDKEEDAIYLADKCANLRIFEDEKQKMNLSLLSTGGAALVISQFTLYGETLRGNRPNFTNAAKPELATPLYKKFIQRLKFDIGEEHVKNGLFGEMMQIHLVNDGPVTIILESVTKNNNQ